MLRSAVVLKLIDQIAGGEEQVDGYGGGEDGPFEPCPAEVEPYHRQQYP